MEIRDDESRTRFARELHGHGVEFGPGTHPLPLGPFATSIRYCDAHDRAGFTALFPNLADEVSQFPDPIDFRLQFDREPFVDVVGRGSLDFVVANHLLEHLIDPIRFLEQCYAVLAPGGLLFLGLPDKRRTFDRDRQRTPLADLITRYQAGELEASDERILEFVNTVERPNSPVRIDDPGIREYLALQRRRSVHLNVWIPDDIIELLLYLGRQRGMPWALYDGAIGGGEFLFLLRKAEQVEVLEQYPTTLARLHAEAIQRQADRATDGLRRDMAKRGWLVRGIKRVATAVPGGRMIRKLAG
jgi:SAM-dependent methyltransferase